jgi:hypothetical protein
MKKKSLTPAIHRGFNPTIAEKVCERIAAGESLRAICGDTRMPGRTTISRWLAENEGFQKAMGLARDMQTDSLADEVLHIADHEPDPHRARIRIDARIWFASKVRPKKYGSKPDEPEQEKVKVTVVIGGNASM